ncbi:MAG: TIM barrel protein, partial [Nanoarchaeota archaeon]|nr:TIM barrel protein [Nanoarchaeota archaeon]
ISSTFSEKEKNLSPQILLGAYSDFLKGGKVSQIMEKLGEPYKEGFQERVSALVHGDTYLRDAYHDLQNMFNQAYEVALKNDSKGDIKRLDGFRDEIAPNLKHIKDPMKLQEFADQIVRGVNLMRGIHPPQAFKSLKEFAIDKSSDTFSNIAFKAYKEFKDSTPIISIENPPVGMGLARANELKAVVDMSRDKLRDKFIQDGGLSKSEAEKQAEKLIGITWDVGHINMLRKYGYTDEDIVAQTKTVAERVKHVHLSDNFGMEHTELPMGMGNVPVKPMLEAIHKYNKQVKKIVETGGSWFRDFKVTPMRETLRAFGSPLYSMKMAPNWGQFANTSEGYFAGYGTMLPEMHFSTYGSGFSNLPQELGGQMGGRSRMGGAPIE